ncbi:PBSX family phage terminase large subunit [Nocardiopsis sp. HUAS JQ3]|uniref:PBSX family phage terminase large subunit n=1 Tax=Nocardiopsis sp. HUAS JQ3 TaxID=3061629 RepID=UPI0023A9EC16|nr:terminase family protein [Nocardiopsis sp. HUAS JQ3]WDZ91158.1 terminase family protein [Nocardiopsis sp. HUAS JQ3]
MAAPVLPLSRRQIESVATSTARVNLWHGAIRSGKTFASLLRWLTYVATAPRGGELVIIGRTRESIGRNVLGPLSDPELFGSVAHQVHYTPGAPVAYILGRRVHVIGASDSKAEKVLRGLTCAGAYVDELTIVSREFFVQLLGRMSVPGAQLFATTNPDSPGHWAKADYLDRLDELPDWRAWKFVLDDNPSLSNDIRASYHREFTGLWRKRFIWGEWVAAEGAILDMWNPDRHVIPWAELPPMTRTLGLGVDHGTANPTAAITLGLGADGRLYLTDEYRHEPRRAETRLTDGQLSERLREWLGQQHHPHGAAQARPEWIAVDPAAASFRLQLYRDGIAAANANNDVKYGVSMLATLLASGQLFVSDRVKGFISEAPGYSWDDDARTKTGEEKPLKIADHSLDAARYAIATTEALWRPHLAAPLELAA